MRTNGGRTGSVGVPNSAINEAVGVAGKFEGNRLVYALTGQDGPFLGAADYMNMRKFELSAALVYACIVLMAWTLPNALFFYMARRKFAESAESKPQSQEK